MRTLRWLLDGAGEGIKGPRDPGAGADWVFGWAAAYLVFKERAGAALSPAAVE